MKRRVGRPQLPPEQRRETVRTRVEPKKIASISLYAATRGMSVGQLIDEYVRASRGACTSAEGQAPEQEYFGLTLRGRVR